MSDVIDEVAKVLSVNWRNMHTNESLGHQRMLAHALDHAGLLATPERDAEHRRAGAVGALREAVTAMRACRWHSGTVLDDPVDPETAYSADRWLEVYADRIEAKS